MKAFLDPFYRWGKAKVRGAERWSHLPRIIHNYCLKNQAVCLALWVVTVSCVFLSLWITTCFYILSTVSTLSLWEAGHRLLKVRLQEVDTGLLISNLHPKWLDQKHQGGGTKLFTGYLEAYYGDNQFSPLLSSHYEITFVERVRSWMLPQETCQFQSRKATGYRHI